MPSKILSNSSVLREFFGEGAEGLEKRFLAGLISLEHSQNQQWINVEDSNLAFAILRSFSDEEKNKILNAVMHEPKVISEILDICKIPQTSGYTKLNSLIEDGLITSEGTVTAPDGTILQKYRTIFEDIHIDTAKNNVIIKILVSEKYLENSFIMQIVCSR